MNDKLKTLLEKNIIIAGVIDRTDDGFIIVTRVNDIEELEKLEAEGKEISYATKSMGRAVFMPSSSGKFTNIKGVDSGLGEFENLVTRNVDANIVKINNPVFSGHHEISLMAALGSKGIRKLEFRFKGTSPLEDLEIEADINKKMSSLGIKVPRIESVKEFSKERAAAWGLPVHRPGDYEEMVKTSGYGKQDRARKKRISSNSDLVHSDTLEEGFRPELLTEYFERHGLFERAEFQDFIEKENEIRRQSGKEDLTIADAIGYVDMHYSLGQRFGQATRIVESPFRISDIEYYVAANNVGALKAIAEFTESTLEECKDGTRFETVFARNMGQNLGYLLNNGWNLENMVHRQDYDLAGEMCDDAYFGLREKIQDLTESESNLGKRTGMINDYKKDFLSQIHFVSSNIKILQDSMRLRGASEEEISSVLDSFIDSFIGTLDIDALSQNLVVDKENAIKQLMGYFDINNLQTDRYNEVNIPEDYPYVKGQRDYVLEMAGKSRREGVEYDDAILNANNGYQEFYRKVSYKLLERFKNKRLETAYKDADITQSDLSDALGLLSKTKTDKEENKDVKSQDLK